MKLFQLLRKQVGIGITFFKNRSFFQKIILVVFIISLLWYGATLFSSSQSTQSTYQTATVESGSLVTSLSASGVVESGSTVSITTSSTGVVSEVFVKPGDTVAKGDTIATLTLDSESLQKQAAAWAAYLSAKNSLNAATAKLHALQASLFTANQTFVNGAGTIDPIIDDPTYIIQRANWLQAEADYKNQQSVIEGAQASVSSAWLSYALLSSTITAPESGIISNLVLSPGLSLSVSDSTTNQSYGSVTLPNNQIKAVVNLTEIDVVKVEVGQKVVLTLDAFPGKTFSGIVSTINTNGVVSSGVTTYPTIITFDTVNKNIYKNMGVNAKIITSIIDDALLVPNAAITTSNGESRVKVLKDNVVESVTVEIGQSNETQTQILSGLRIGDTVITNVINATKNSSSTTSVFGGQGFGSGVRAFPR